MKKMKPCILCGSDVLYVVSDEDRLYIMRYGIFCNTCKTTFSNENFDEYEDETISWWNSIKRDEQ